MSGMPIRPCTTCGKGSDSHQRCSMSQCPMRRNVTAQVGGGNANVNEMGKGHEDSHYGSGGSFRKIPTCRD